MYSNSLRSLHVSYNLITYAVVNILNVLLCSLQILLNISWDYDYEGF